MLLVNAATVGNVEEGPAINDRPRPGQERKLDGRQEAQSFLGHRNSWPLPRVWRPENKPWKKKEWCIPKVAFVAQAYPMPSVFPRPPGN